jgi:hypothetical protein
MRTKTVLLTSLLGALSSVSVMAQTNVYSLNAVGYINVTVYPGYNIVTVPLMTTPDNTIGTVLNNANSNLTTSTVYFYSPSLGYTSGLTDTAKNYSPSPGLSTTTNANGWANNGTNVASPGVAFWFENKGTNPLTLTFVGTVPTGPITNTLVSGLNLVGSVVPMSGDLVTNPISDLTNYNVGDGVYIYTPTNAVPYFEYASAGGIGGGHGYHGNWSANGDPIVPNVGEGFFYDNKVGTTVEWVEDYSVSQ